MTGTITISEAITSATLTDSTYSINLSNTNSVYPLQITYGGTTTSTSVSYLRMTMGIGV